MSLTLTADQQTALDAFTQFLADPAEPAFVLGGYSGTGKSTLVSHLIELLPSLMKTIKLFNPKLPAYEIVLTATTNKAAENLAHITGMSVSTIHSYLGLRVQTDYSNDTTSLIPRSHEKKRGVILFIDEASYIDSPLLTWIFKLTEHCKIVFIGDPAQLTPVKSNSTPVFEAKFPHAQLSQVVRQAEGNPIIDLATRFRNTVNTGDFFSFTPDGTHIQYLTPDAFSEAVEKEFTRPDWRYRDSKILAWTNKRVIAYNHAIQQMVQGNPHFQVGDYAICNSYVTAHKKSIKTDQLVCITGISDETTRHDVLGRYYTLDYALTLFGANSLAERNARIKQAKAEDRLEIVSEIDGSWVDLRSAYACTVNKAQGSTYDRVFIDLDDIAKCNNGNTLARMLYVAVSRARQTVYLTGDLI